MRHNRTSGTHTHRLQPRQAGSRCPIRRTILHRSHVYEDLLPPDLPCAAGEAIEHYLFPLRSRGCGSGIQALPALPARNVAWNTRVARNIRKRIARIEIDR